MTKTDAWRRLAVETPEGATLLFDPSEVFYLEVDALPFHAAHRGPPGPSTGAAVLPLSRELRRQPGEGALHRGRRP